MSNNILPHETIRQKAWFDDGVICAWSSDHQEKQITEMEKRSMTSVPQVFDTDQIPIRLKSCQKRKEKALRKELMRVAQLEGHQTR